MGERESRAYSLSILFVFALSSEKFLFPIKPQFFLDSFPAFIYCYLFLCKIAEHITPSISLAIVRTAHGQRNRRRLQRMENPGK